MIFLNLFSNRMPTATMLLAVDLKNKIDYFFDQHLVIAYLINSIYSYFINSKELIS